MKTFAEWLKELHEQETVEPQRLNKLMKSLYNEPVNWNQVAQGIYSIGPLKSAYDTLLLQMQKQQAQTPGTPAAVPAPGGPTT